MKPDIHPKYRNVTVQFPQGDSFKTKSTYPGEKMILDVYFRTHPAWTKKGIAGASETSTTVSKFNKKFAGFEFSMKK